MSAETGLPQAAQPLLEVLESLELRERLAVLLQRLQQAREDYGQGLVFANSLGAEDALLTGLLAECFPDVQQFVLDTGRLPEETQDVLERMQRRWPQLAVQVYYPDAEKLQAWVAANSVNAFYRSQELRESCCGVRKLEPLRRALAGRTAWITGLRRTQSVTREALEYSQPDDSNGLQKLSPLFDWSETDVWALLHALKFPYNRLHDQGYPSIGCAPCTRAVSLGDDPRSGRWWWENPDNRECGLHPR